MRASSWNSGAMSTPASAASVVDSIQEIDDMRSTSIPRSRASPRRSTPARVSRPTRVWRSTTHSTSAETSTPANTASWLVSTVTVPTGFHVVLGVGPRPGGWNTCSLVGSPRSKRSLACSTTHRHSAGRAMSRPTVPTMRWASGALARLRIINRSSTQPSSGAYTRMVRTAATAMGRPCPPAASGWLSWKNRNAAEKATAPWATLKMPDVWYVSTNPAAMMA